MSNAAQPFVSILMPCYNAEAFIADALESVLAQTWSNIEVVVVDDGSLDGSREVVETFSDRGVRLIARPNAGAAAARNHAFLETGGHFVLFLDADDLVGPSHVAALFAAIAGTPHCVAMGPWDRFFNARHEAAFRPRSGYRDATGPEWLAAEWMNAQPMMQSGTFLIPRPLVEAHGGWDERLSLNDDFEFFTRIISRSAGVRFAPDARLYYRSGIKGSLSGRQSRFSIESAFLSSMLATQHLLGAEDSPRSRRACANILQSFEYKYYPAHDDLRAKIRARVVELGGSDLVPDGPPGFHKVRRWFGWRAARHVQHLAESLKFNGVSRRRHALDASLRAKFGS